MLKIIKTVAELREELSLIRGQNKTGFVPTMGNLHQGHIDLVNKAREISDVVIASIFVNPMQFSAGEDLEKYPRTLESDIEKLSTAGADILFTPDVSEIYGESIESSTKVIVPGLSELWCGASRPGHFHGVTTVVNKLFNLVQPDVAVFGEKDFQQLTIIRKMVHDLKIPVEIIGVPTRREANGLAMSSRNGYLTEKQREIAPLLNKTLLAMKNRVSENNGEMYSSVIDWGQQQLKAAGFVPDYLAICHADDLQPAFEGDQNLVILAAAFLGQTRLIDNLKI